MPLKCHACGTEMMEGFLLNGGKIYCKPCYEGGGKASGTNPDAPST